MKKIFSLLTIVFIIISIFIVYLSTIGINTSRWNEQIGSFAKNINEDLETELKDVKIILDPFSFEINVKTIGPKLKINDTIIELANIKSRVSLNSFISNNFSIKNLDISTRSLEIKNMISFFRNFKNSPELYLLEKVLKRGYLITDINLDFDENGKIKNNYNINGFIKDANINLFKKYQFNNMNLTFNITPNTYKLQDVGFDFNSIPFLSENVLVKKDDDSFFVEGIIENKDISLKDQTFNNFVKAYLSEIDFKNLNLNSKNQFSFNVNKKLKMSNLKFFSKIKLNNLQLINNFELKEFFPNFKREINFNDHLIDISYKKDNLVIKGKGDILLQEKEDEINYQIKKIKKKVNFETRLKIDKNPFLVKLLGYKKGPNIKANLNLKGSHVSGKETKIESFFFKENQNTINVEKLVFDKNFDIKNLKKISFNYFDEDNRENNFSIINKKQSYSFTGTKFNASSLIGVLIDGEDSDNFNALKSNFNLYVKLDKVYLDKDYILNDLSGNLNIKKNQILKGKLDGSFSKNKKFKFTVKTNENEKVTTLYLDQPEPIINRYKFIKGYKNGILDFYSSKKDNIAVSNLKIYDFRLTELPILTKLLTLASLQGIADILSGEGIAFDELEMKFNNQENLITIDEMYAIGPAISILLDGYVEKNKLVSLRGSLVPATTINKAIGNIPVLGKILVGSKTGEGVFGVSFKIKGPPKKLETSVNPIKTLTPRFITRTLEKIKKN